MDSDDLEPARPTGATKILEAMSVEALGEYVDELQAEVKRAQAMIESKLAARSSADSVFKN
ncbi:MAG: DUF1192 domain-containing protein [Alphaproteobacteria bacterium]|jgi:uncharacterized small protein (DUF1192 family)|nr:DUF1192 domain-containing protein [Rhodospirillaceae bacterium]MBT6202943.1 DUF1192 domain-containing protein [Rhodospirillaceae bacterium]MBT6509382.1 DUF1192 domain-containing protein [Rhodospirillaceae bacterium]MBT7646583.1 DUF1192 domain-containing protein [Rhodospirillaceae bacterium]MDG2480483.1 DUF1192 domain-containing protein [Alphaproteobacteria bacterium]